MSSKPAIIEAQAIATVQPDEALPGEHLLKLAIEHKASVETMERIMAVRRELRAEKAKEAYDKALAAFQAQCPVLKKGKVVSGSGGFGYTYAPMDSIISQVRGLLEKNGFSYSTDTKVDNNGVTAIVRVTHCGGHSESSQFWVPIDAGGKMSQPQKFGSARTFAMRYSFCNALGIMTGDEDNDAARTRTDKPPGAAPGEHKPEATTVKTLKKKLWELLAPVRGGEANWKQAELWLLDKALLSETETVSTATEKRLEGMIEGATKILS